MSRKSFLVIVSVLSLVSAADAQWYQGYDFASRGAVAFFPFDANATDYSGNSNNGSITGGGSFEVGPLGGNALHLTPGQYVTVPSSPSIQNYTQFTYATWKKVVSPSDGEYTMGKGSDGGYPQISIRNTLSGTAYGTMNNSYAYDPVDIPYGTWSHQALVYDGTSVKIYANGVLRGTSVDNPGPINTRAEDPLFFNKHEWFDHGSSSSRMNVVLDEAVVFNVALSAPDVAKLASDSDSDGIVDFWDSPAPPTHEMPRVIHYQGKLRDGVSGSTVNGPVTMRFRLYDSTTAASPVLFDETQNGVTVTHGLLATLIGSATSGGIPDTAFDADTVFLGISVNGGSELQPRSRVASTAYTFKGRSAEQLVKPGTFEAAVVVNGTGYVGIGETNPQHPIDTSTGAYLSAGGAWTNASSAALKDNIAPLSAQQAIEALFDLEPVTFTYKSDPSDPQVGFIAETVPALVATSDRMGLGAMDIVAVLTKVVKEQDATIKTLRRESEVRERILQSRIDALERRLAD